ncbi:MAG TPA: RtcB family protein [Chloroflexaceae bacterium]|nr:RtcB family protein [Chloroflexaceae bacterium]
MEDRATIFGEPDERTLAQLRRVAADPRVARAALMADAHVGYSMPIGGVAAYRNAVSPSGAGYDIACGIKAVATDLRAADVLPTRAARERIADTMAATIAFGMGRTNPDPVDHPLFDDPLWRERELAPLKAKAAAQLGTVGAGNHFVDLLADEAGRLWVMAHFGSRGLGHTIASGFLNLAAGRRFADRAPGEAMDQPPTVIGLDSQLGQYYQAAHNLAGDYAYAGRDAVVGQVLALLGARAVDDVHIHHNFCFVEEHDGETLVVVRKGATPLAPGQRGAMGGSMGGVSAVVRGRDTTEARAALSSAPHGAGRIMSRTQAAGKKKWVAGPGGKKRPTRVSPGQVTRAMMDEALAAADVVLRGGDEEEAPHVYRDLRAVLAAHAATLEVEHWLHPLVVCMAPSETFDPYKD